MLQPNYIPWKGVFDLISRVDVFVFYDDVQYTTKDWRNRNKIKTPNGDLWLTVPVKTRNARSQLIYQAEIDNSTPWQDKHLKSLWASYRKTKFFTDYEELLEQIYQANTWTSIADLNIFSTKLIAESLGIDVEWQRSSNLGHSGGKNGEKIIKICKQLGCNYFINGPSSRPFMDQSLFDKSGVVLDYIKYNYPEYQQAHGEFNHNVSILDVLFNVGPSAKEFVCRGGVID